MISIFYEIINILFRDTEKYPVVGLDCQWVRNGSENRRVSLLQLASYGGTIALIRLHKLETIPDDLRDILMSQTIIKAGFKPRQDANFLQQDYGLEVNGTFDLRFLARDNDVYPGGLESLAIDVLGVNIGADVEIMASNWEQEPLDDKQKEYAEAAVKASFDIFKKLLEKKFWFPTRNIHEYTEQYLDLRYELN